MTELKKIVLEVDGKEVTIDVAEAEKLYELLRRLLGKVELAPVVVYPSYPVYIPAPTYAPIIYPAWPQPDWTTPTWTITC